MRQPGTAPLRRSTGTLAGSGWNVLTRPLESWRVDLDGARHEVTLVERLAVTEDVLRRELAFPAAPVGFQTRLALIEPRLRVDVLVDGHSHTGSAWDRANPHARERAFRIYGHRCVVRIEDRRELAPVFSLYVDEVLEAPACPRPRRRSPWRLARALFAAAVG